MRQLRCHRTADGVAVLLLDEPDRRNAIDHGVVDALEHCLFDSGHAAVVLGSACRGMFCAGGDLSLDDEALGRLSDRIFDLCIRLLTSPTVLIVAADGMAVGSGAQLFMAADLRFVGADAWLRPADPVRSLLAGTWSLPVSIGRPRTLQLLLTGARLGARDLVELGLAAGIDDDPVAAAVRTATEIAKLDERYRSRVKRAVAAASFPSPEALDIERATFRRPGRDGSTP